MNKKTFKHTLNETRMINPGKKLLSEYNTNLRILLVNHFNILSPRVEQEVHTLYQQGTRIHLAYWQREQETTPLVHPDFFEGVTPVRLRTSHGLIQILPRLPVLYMRMVKSLRSVEYDAVHCTHLLLLPVCYILARMRNARLVYDVYEFHLLDTHLKLPRPLRPLVAILKAAERALVRRCDLILTIDSAAGWLETYYRNLNNNVVVLYNVPDLNRTPPRSLIDEMAQRYRGKEVITYIGGISEIKGAFVALEAASQVLADIPNAHFLFIGRFMGGIEQRFWRVVHTKGLDGHIEHIPWVPYETMLAYLHSAKVGLALHQPMRRFYLVSRGNGRKFFTYMQAGLPIVAPQLGELGRVVEEETCGLVVDTTDPKAVAGAIIYLLKHPEKARLFGQQGRRAVETKYNWTVESEKLLRGYQHILTSAT